MSIKRQYDFLSAQLTEARRLVDELNKIDPIGAVSMRNQVKTLERQLAELSEKVGTLAKAAVSFEGAAVRGSYGINLQFASEVLDKIYKVISKELALMRAGEIGTRGPLPKVIHNEINITSVVHGSFGFMLEEDDSDGEQLFDSGVKTSTQNLIKHLSQISSERDSDFIRLLQDQDSRILSSYRDLFKSLADHDSWFSVSSGSDELRLSRESTLRGHARLQKTTINESEERFEGVLLGLIPISRRFEFRTIPTHDIVRGDVSVKLAQSFLRVQTHS